MLFFFCGSLPPLFPGVRPELSTYQFLEMAEENLLEYELETINEVREFIDILNIKKLIKKQQIDSRGTKTEKELDDAIMSLEGLPDVVINFLSEYESKEERIEKFPLLLSEYFKFKITHSRGYLQSYFERQYLLQLSFTALRTSNGAGDIAYELRYENPKDPFIAQLLAQKESGTFVFPYELEHLNDPLSSAKEPIEYYRVLLEDTYSFAMEYCEKHVFTLGYAVAYFTALLAIEEYDALDEQQGNTIIEGMA